MSATLGKGLRLLEALCLAREPVGITALSREIDMNLSAVQRLLGTLVALGYAEQVQGRRYRATLMTWEIGAQVLRGDSIRRSVHPILRQAAHTTGYTAFFMMNNVPFATYFDKVEGKNGLIYSAELGTTVPIGATASGLAIAAFLDASQREKLLTPAKRSQVEYIPPTDSASFEATLATIRDQRYATSQSGFRKGVNSIAAPVWIENGSVCGSIALTADENELKADDFAELGRVVVRWADEATVQLGGIPYPQDHYSPA